MVEQVHHPSTPIDERETFSPLWDFAGMVGGALFSPVRTLREVGQREAIVPAIFLVILVVGVSVSGQVAALLAGRHLYGWRGRSRIMWTMASST
jgi:hypothetical protein